MLKRALRSSVLAFAVFFAMWSQAFAMDIVRAVLNGDAATVQQYLAAGADPNTMHPTGRSLLAVASSRGHTDVVRVLVEGGADIELGWPSLGSSPIMAAARKGHDEVVGVLIAAGANVNHTDSLQITPLGMAIHEGHENVVRLLVNAGATINPSDISSASELGHTGIVKILEGVEPETAVKAASDALSSAVQAGDVASVRKALSSGADPNALYLGQSLLFYAAGNDHLEVVTALLDSGADVDLGWAALDTTPLMAAANKGHDEIVQILIAAGANIEHTNTMSLTALRLAAIGGHEKVVQALLAAGAKADSAALEAAEKKGHLKVAEILRKAGAR